MKFEVGEELVKPIIRDQVAAAIAAQLGDPAKLMQELVGKALNQKVNAHGKVGNYSSDNKYPFLEALAANAIRQAAREAFEEIVKQEQPRIRAAVESHLRKQPKKTAAAIVSAFAEGAGCRYSTKVDFTFTPTE